MLFNMKYIHYLSIFVGICLAVLVTFPALELLYKAVAGVCYLGLGVSAASIIVINLRIGMHKPDKIALLLLLAVTTMLIFGGNEEMKYITHTGEVNAVLNYFTYIGASLILGGNIIFLR